MAHRNWLLFLLLGAFGIQCLPTISVRACCPAPPSGKRVINADQTVILLWDAATKTQHFIRKASSKSESADFGFLVPTPAQPELNESGNEAFPYLQKLTEPEVRKVSSSSGGMSCSCSEPPPIKKSTKSVVRVLQEKLVAGFKAVVLEADSATALVDWLKKNGYAYSPEIEAWAKPYVASGWKITALKLAKGDDEQTDQNVTASALRITFKTDRPLFPYREPDSTKSATALGVNQRLLRIYFLADARYGGELTKESPWTGKVAWAGQLSAENLNQVCEMLKLEKVAEATNWWLTEFEDPWPYQVAPADLYFARDASQNPIKRPPIVEYVAAPSPRDLSVYALAGVLLVPPLWRRIRRRGCRGPATTLTDAH